MINEQQAKEIKMLTNEQTHILKGYIEMAQDDLKDGTIEEVDGVYPTVIELVIETFEDNEDLKIDDFSPEGLRLQAWFNEAGAIERQRVILEAL